MTIRAKLATTIAALCMVICLLTVGVLAASQGTVNLQGTVGFTLKDVQVTIAGAYSGTVTELGSTTDETIVEADHDIIKWDANSTNEGSDDNTEALETLWNFGALEFKDKNATIVIVVKVQNDNTENAVNATFAPTVGGQALTTEYVEIKNGDTSLNVQAKMSADATIAVGETGLYTISIQVVNKNAKVTAVEVAGDLTLIDEVAAQA